MASAWPRVVTALIGILPTLPGWSGVQVFDGPPNTEQEFTSYITVGHQDGADTGGSFTQDYADDGIFWQESGDVVCRLVVQTGNDDLPTVRTSLFALLDSLQQYLLADRWLAGTLTPEGWSNVTVDPLVVKEASGTAMSLLITLHYYTRI
jgi:hypothetical protein